MVPREHSSVAGAVLLTEVLQRAERERQQCLDLDYEETLPLLLQPPFQTLEGRGNAWWSWCINTHTIAPIACRSKNKTWTPNLRTKLILKCRSYVNTAPEVTCRAPPSTSGECIVLLFLLSLPLSVHIQLTEPPGSMVMLMRWFLHLKFGNEMVCVLLGWGSVKSRLWGRCIGLAAAFVLYSECSCSKASGSTTVKARPVIFGSSFCLGRVAFLLRLKLYLCCTAQGT